MILVDTNVLMYAAGADSRHKEASARFLERVGSGEVDAVIDAEVLQEVLHRYRVLMDGYPDLMARDALHAAVVLVNELDE